MFKAWIQKIENKPISLWQSIFLIFIIILFRTFLESAFINPYSFNHLEGIINTFFLYPAYWIGVFISILILIKILTGEKMEKISRVGIFSFFFILFAPIFDFVTGKSFSHSYAFITGSVNEIANSFLSLLGGAGISLGLRIALIVGIIAVGYYVFYKTKKIWRAFIGGIIFYVIVFAFAIAPVIIFGAYNLVSGNAQELTPTSIENFYFIEEPANTVMDYRSFILDRNIFKQNQVQNIKNVENQPSITVSVALLITSIFLLAWYLFLYSRKKFLAVLKNVRYLIFGHYYLMIFLGIYLGILFSQRIPIGSLFDFASFLSLFFAFFFAGLFSTWENDEEDMEIDKISNQGRSLLSGEFTPIEWRDLKFLFLLFSLGFAFLAGWYTFIFILLFLAIYHVYSSSPLRLKRFLGISSVLIAFNALLAVFMGFFMSSGTESFSAFPLKYLLGIPAIVFLVENVKNLKDIKGDKKAGIKTLPVVLGEKRGKLAIGITVFLAALLVSIIFHLTIYTFITAFLFGLIFFLLINRKKFIEKHIYMAYFIAVVVFALVILLLG